MKLANAVFLDFERDLEAYNGKRKEEIIEKGSNLFSQALRFHQE